MIKNLLEYSIKHNLRHIPSALSQYSYLKYIFKDIIKNNWNISIGKPFGAQAYYVLCDLDHDNLSYGMKHEEIDFINFSEETLGNALGVASGLEIGNNKKTYCNISDGALQMGATLEAIQFIGHRKQNILLTVDFNGMQLTDSTENIMGIDIHNAAKLFEIYGWDVCICNTKNDNVLDTYNIVKNNNNPCVILFETIKGQGVKEMEENPVLWHYKQLENIKDITLENF